MPIAHHCLAFSDLPQTPFLLSLALGPAKGRENKQRAAQAHAQSRAFILA